MIKYLKQYADKSFEELVNSLIWFDNPLKLKAIFAKLQALISANEPKYKVYTALLTQSGTDAPVATVLENTLGGDIVWSRVDVGNYLGTLNNTFLENKVFFKVTNGESVSDCLEIGITRTSEDLVNLLGYGIFEGVISSFDINSTFSIEIRVYN